MARADEQLERLRASIRETRAGLAEMAMSGGEHPDAIGQAERRFKVLAATAHELQEMVTRLSPEAKLDLGLDVLRTGIDSYAASVRLTNTGIVPILVVPQKFAVHYLDESAVPAPVANPRFLQTTMLEPGR